MALDASAYQGRLVDLHLHIDGSISVASARRLAQIGSSPLDMDDNELFSLLSVGESCESLDEYLARFEFPLSLLQTSAQISESVYLLQEELRAKGLAYAELRFAPQSQCRCGLSQREVVEASLEGLGRSDLEARLILCCMRGADNLDANIETVRLAAEYLGRGVVGLDLAGAEALFPTRDYAPVFGLASRLGVPYTIHAGEADGPASVRAALELGASRIGHGVRSIEDMGLVRELARRQVPLEVCVTSEIQTGALGADTYAQTLRTLLDEGVLITINSDNCMVSDTWVGRELERVADALSLTADDVGRLLANAVEASFAEEQVKRQLRVSVAC